MAILAYDPMRITMRNAQRIVLTLLIMFVLAGCKTGKKETPTQIDAANQEAQRLTAQAPTITWTPWPTPWPATATRTPQRKTPTPTSASPVNGVPMYGRATRRSCPLRCTA